MSPARSGLSTNRPARSHLQCYLLAPNLARTHLGYVRFASDSLPPSTVRLFPPQVPKKFLPLPGGSPCRSIRLTATLPVLPTNLPSEYCAPVLDFSPLDNTYARRRSFDGIDCHSSSGQLGYGHLSATPGTWNFRQSQPVSSGARHSLAIVTVRQPLTRSCPRLALTSPHLVSAS